MGSIRRIHAREVFDSRGNPTVEAEVHGPGGVVGRAIVPSGASTGTHEAVELRDHDPQRLGGKGVLQAIQNIRERIAPALIGRSLLDQADIDEQLSALDATENLSGLGANAILAVSLATAYAAATLKGVPLHRSLAGDHASIPLPMVNLISGGLHAGSQVEFQDFLAIPVGALSFRQSFEWVWRVHRELAAQLDEQGHEHILVADEGGFGPKLANNREALEILVRAIERSGLALGDQVALALDVASTHFHRDGRYWIDLGQGELADLDSDAMIEMLVQWVDAYPIVSIEDGLAEDDWDGWRQLTQTLGERVQLVGDDLIVTNPDRLDRCIKEKCSNAVLVKPNQVGTLSASLSVLARARDAGLGTIVSARSGETEDTTIADLAVASGAGQIKIGSIVRGERLAKYNQLLRIEEESVGHLRFAGRSALPCARPRGRSD